MAKKHLLPALAAGALALTGCAPKSGRLSEEVLRISSELGCADAETRLFDRLIDGDLGDPARNPASVRLELLGDLRRELGDRAELAALDEALRFLLEEAPARFPVKTREAQRELYIAMELGTSNSPEEKALAREYQDRYHEAWNAVKGLGLECAAGPRASALEKAMTPHGFAAAAMSPMVKGMKWTFAVAYQSCEVLQQKALTTADPEIQGITIRGHHSDGVGSKRFITDLPAVQRTHPYLRPPPAASCLDVRKNPLIYDYGGRPFTNATSVDLHKNSGSGTSVLGIDCSAYVGTALATAGLKTKQSVPIRPEQAGKYSSHDFLNPEKEGLNCLQRIPLKPGETLRDGDIVAVAGHVFMLDRIGADPFGIRGITKVEDCAKATYEKFDFEIFQSSPQKNGVGLNRFRAADYLREKEGKIRSGLEKYAVQACKNRLNSVTSTPKYSDLSVIRHKGTAACTDKRVPIAREACVDACFGGG